VKIAALGDVATASVLVSRIRAEFTNAHITWLCGRGAASLVQLFDVDEIITVDEETLLRGSLPVRVAALARHWVRVAGRRFDRVITVHGDARYRLLSATVRRGMHTALGDPLTATIGGRFRGDEIAGLLDPNGVSPATDRRFDVADVRNRLASPAWDADESPYVVLVPAGTRNVLREDALRRWPAERYAELARRLRARGFRVALAGGVQDRWVRPLFAGVDVEDYLGTLEIPDTLRLMRDAALVVSHDTGPLHLARLVRAPIVALFGPTMPNVVLPGDAAALAIWGGAHLACRPCYNGRDYAPCRNNRCMQSIGVDDVLEQALLVAGQPRTRRAITK